jgi:hypothetical protein
MHDHNVRCDEPGATGRSDAISKVTYEERQKEVQNLRSGNRAKLDCVIVSRSKVLEGVGQYVVIAVGPKSFNGRIMAGKSCRLDFFCILLTIFISPFSQYQEHSPAAEAQRLG